MKRIGNNFSALDPLFVDRWSSRQYSDKPLSAEQRNTLFEAARWAPSCFNEQPWFFIVAESDTDRAEHVKLLADANQEWASKAPLLCFLAAARKFQHNEKPNRHFAYDTGAAWMALALQAHLMGLSAHAMGGFDLEKAYSVLGVDKEKYEIMSAISVGFPQEDAHESEERTDRKLLSKVFGQTLK